MGFMKNITAQVIADMLVEPTGTHMCDSGGESNRHWQQNQGKTVQDFKEEPRLTFEWQSEKKRIC